jgi:hypothetical protein
VPAKKTRQGKAASKPAGKAVYLLSADRKYRRLSLKKISERAKGTRRPARGRSIVKAVTPAETPSLAHREVAPAKVASIALVLSGLILVASLVGASWSASPAADTSVAAAQKEDVRVLTADVASSPAIPVKPDIAPSVAKVPPVPSASPVPAAVTTTAVLRATETVKVRTEIAPAPAPVRASALADTQVAVPAASIDTVTISGCLDFDGKAAWLKNTSGIDTPRTRSWRSGFLKKSTPRIALVDGPASVEAYDGRQVSVTGVLVDRQMHVSSLKPIADDCQ